MPWECICEKNWGGLLCDKGQDNVARVCVCVGFPAFAGTGVHVDLRALVTHNQTVATRYCVWLYFGQWSVISELGGQSSHGQ